MRKQEKFYKVWKRLHTLIETNVELECLKNDHDFLWYNVIQLMYPHNLHDYLILDQNATSTPFVPLLLNEELEWQ